MPRPCTSQSQTQNAKNLYNDLQADLLQIDHVLEDKQNLKIEQIPSSVDQNFVDDSLTSEDKKPLKISDKFLLEKNLFSNLFFKYVSLRQSIQLLRQPKDKFKKGEIFQDFFFNQLIESRKPVAFHLVERYISAKDDLTEHIVHPVKPLIFNIFAKFQLKFLNLLKKDNLSSFYKKFLVGKHRLNFYNFINRYSPNNTIGGLTKKLRIRRRRVKVKSNSIIQK